ncbi:MAG: HAMP domain-containing histidine kinase [Cyclobacteriaceae bacterium]
MVRQKLIIIIIGTILLPIAAYVMYELSNIDENEEVIEGIYRDQLETILFSVNQYSNDVMSSFVGKIEEQYDPGSVALKQDLTALLSLSGFNAFIISPLDSVSTVKPFSYNGTPYPNFMTRIGERFIGNVSFEAFAQGQEVQQLKQYARTGYRKLEPVALVNIEEDMYQIIASVVIIQEQPYLFTGFIEPLSFVQEVMSPKMQEISQDQMVIALSREDDPGLLYSTDSLNNDIFVTSKMWLFPEFLVGVSPQNETVSQLVSKRLRNNLIAVGLLIVLLVIGFTLIIKSLNNEMRLAHTKAEFVSNVSHELRTPLSLISMFAETLMLGRVKREEKKQEYFEIIFKETHRLSNIVNRILNFSRIEANKRIYSMAPVELNSLMAEVIQDYAFHLDRNGFKYKLTKSAGEALIDGDREAIYEAVVNLVDNAVKYSNEKKELEIEVSLAGDETSIRVTDWGRGIPAEKKEHIFEKFYRGGYGDVYSTQGAGLGLSIVKHIMDAHHGRIEVESKEERGSTFELVFNLT